jgi:alpha/beta superfamily hydrolase
VEKTMKEQPVTFASDGLELEGLLALADSADAPAAVVCHPHPLYGGSMHNNVVDAILEALQALGCATLRFNFRGVGRSGGGHDGGPGEAADALAALRFLRAQPGVRADGSILAGYSFGAMVALRAGLAAREVAQVVAVALPVGMADFSSLAPAPKPVLLVSGDSDSYSPVSKLAKLKTGLGASARLDVIKGADHFFGGYEPELAAAVRSALRDS